jgi:hypothetical protein
MNDKELVAYAALDYVKIIQLLALGPALQQIFLLKCLRKKSAMNH